MKQLALMLAAAGALTTAVIAVPSNALALETEEAKMQATDAASQALYDMFEIFGFKQLKPGQYLWRDVPESAGRERVVIALTEQLAFLYRGDKLMAVATISTGRFDKPSPIGIFSVLDKKPFYRSKKYDNAPMPWMQRIDQYGIALHGGYNPGYPASHGCIRLPLAFAKKLYSITDIGTPVLIGA
jgi:alkylation response protein AidB-like acyl-CoA dehydrogenase